MSEKLLELEVKISEKDYIKFNYSHISKKMKGLKPFVIFWVIFIIIIGVMGFQGLLEESFFELYLPFFKFVSIIAIIIVLFWVLIRYSASKTYRSNKFIIEKNTYSFYNEGIFVKSESGEVTISWNKIYKVERIKDFYAIFISTVQVYVFPKRCFDEESVEQFRTIMTNNLEKKKVKL